MKNGQKFSKMSPWDMLAQAYEPNFIPGAGYQEAQMAQQAGLPSQSLEYLQSAFGQPLNLSPLSMDFIRQSEAGKFGKR